MIPDIGPRITWTVLAILLGWSFASAQQVQQTPLSAPVAQKTVQQTAVEPVIDPYPLTRQQRDAVLSKLTAEHRRELSHLAMDVANGRRMSSIQSNWAGLINELYASGSAPDVESLIQLTMHMSYQQMQGELYELAARVQQLNEKKAELRSRIALAREQKWPTSKIESMEGELATLSDLTQMASFELQQKQQEQQQIMQTFANIIKMFHDTAMTMIRNLK